MVQSLLIPDLEYEENRSLLPEDKDKESSIYEITLFGKDETIALGQPVYAFIERNLVYYPIYLVKNDKVALQIGLYEVLAENVSDVLDDDGDVDLDLMGQPLLYKFTKASASTAGPSTAGPSTAGPSTAGPNANSGVVIETTEKKALSEQTVKEAEQEREHYIEKTGQHWFQTYTQNNNYHMLDNEGKGDCLFAVIRDSLKQVGISKSVADMRKILAENATEDLFQGYKTLYQEAKEADAQLLKEIKTLVARHKELKTKMSEIKDRNAKQAIISQADEVKQRHDLAKRERMYTRSVIEGELETMKNVHNLTQFKALIQTCSFWGDTWAISTLERVLNIKLILFSEESYNAGDLDNVLTCGQLNDTVLEEKGIFEPAYYILTIYQGYHYQLVTYKNKGALTFTEIPYDIKVKVVDKCLERLAGPYYIIPAFRAFMEGIKGLAPLAATVEVEEMQSELYNNDTVFQYYIRSVDKPPGKGTGETIQSMADFKELRKIPDWRRKIDNLWIAPFTLDGHKWQSVEHYYQGAKYKRDNKEIYLQFSLESGSALSKDPVLARDNVIKKVAKKTIKIDEDFRKRSSKELEVALAAKFNQNPELKTLLRETQKAKLQHFIRGTPAQVSTELMQVRQGML